MLKDCPSDIHFLLDATTDGWLARARLSVLIPVLHPAYTASHPFEHTHNSYLPMEQFVCNNTANSWLTEVYAMQARLLCDSGDVNFSPTVSRVNRFKSQTSNYFLFLNAPRSQSQGKLSIDFFSFASAQ